MLAEKLPAMRAETRMTAIEAALSPYMEKSARSRILRGLEAEITGGGKTKTKKATVAELREMRIGVHHHAGVARASGPRING